MFDQTIAVVLAVTAGVYVAKLIATFINGNWRPSDIQEAAVAAACGLGVLALLT